MPFRLWNSPLFWRSRAEVCYTDIGMCTAEPNSRPVSTDPNPKLRGLRGRAHSGR